MRALAGTAGGGNVIGSDGCAVIHSQPLRGCFGTGDVRFDVGDRPALALHLIAAGRGQALRSVASSAPEFAGQEVRYAHGAITEWWRVLPVGFEQGFTVTSSMPGTGRLTLALAASRPAVQRGPDVAFGRILYGGLVVTDADGNRLPATLTGDGNRILVAVDDSDARYPLTVDPLVWLGQKVTASDGAANDNFGVTVEVGDTTAVIGAPYADGGEGAAYLFTLSGGAWTPLQKLTASDGAAGDHFGAAVGLIGSKVTIGAPDASVGGNAGQGAAYEFAKSGPTWVQTAKLTASDGVAGDHFGAAAGMADSMAFVGAPGASVGDNTGQGAAYIFTLSSGVWSQTAKLTASDGAAGDAFGAAVSLNAAFALAGAPQAAVDGNSGQGAAYVFTSSGGIWTQQAKIVAGDGAADDAFGSSVSLISGSEALAGAPHAAVDGNEDQGAAYLFVKSGSVWNQAQKFTASDGAAGDEFGSSAAIGIDTLLVGAVHASVIGLPDRGAAYLFTSSGGSWSESEKLAAADGMAGGRFGAAAALIGSEVLVGSSGAMVGGNSEQGAAYFYGGSNLGLAVSAPATAAPAGSYVSQVIVSNAASATSPAVSVTAAVPAGASFESVTASQGSCSESSGVVSCDFGPIAGNGGTATANISLTVTGFPGDVIDNTATLTSSTPPLATSAQTLITGCDADYTEYQGTLAPGQHVLLPGSSGYHAPAGQENAVLMAPAGFRLFVALPHRHYLRAVPGNEIHSYGPAGLYYWVVLADTNGGNYTFCLNHP